MVFAWHRSFYWQKRRKNHKLLYCSFIFKGFNINVLRLIPFAQTRTITNRNKLIKIVKKTGEWDRMFKIYCIFFFFPSVSVSLSTLQQQQQQQRQNRRYTLSAIPYQLLPPPSLQITCVPISTHIISSILLVRECVYLGEATHLIYVKLLFLNKMISENQNVSSIQICPEKNNTHSNSEVNILSISCFVTKSCVRFT